MTLLLEGGAAVNTKGEAGWTPLHWACYEGREAVALLLLRGASWTFPARGMAWSLVAGIVGAAGAFGVLLAFGARGAPSVVMSIIFAGAPIVNAVVALSIHPPAGGPGGLRWQFVVGIALAALGGCLVMRYKPNPPPPPAGTAVHQRSQEARPARPRPRHCTAARARRRSL